jgi:hypothetical protein
MKNCLLHKEHDINEDEEDGLLRNESDEEGMETEVHPCQTETQMRPMTVTMTVSKSQEHDQQRETTSTQ